MYLGVFKISIITSILNVKLYFKNRTTSPELSISIKVDIFKVTRLHTNLKCFEWFNSKVKRIDEYCLSMVCILFLLTISCVFWLYKHNLLRKSKIQRTSASTHKRIPRNEVLRTINSKSNSNIRKISVTLASYRFTLNKYTFHSAILITYIYLYICKKFEINFLQTLMQNSNYV